MRQRDALSPARTLEGEVLFELFARRGLFLSLTLGVVGYSAGHAGMALSAGVLAKAIASTPFEHPSQALPDKTWDTAIAFSYVGLGAAVVKAGAGSILAFSEKRFGAAVSGRLRLGLVGNLLQDGPSLPAPRVLATLAVRLREIERAVTDGVLTTARALAQLVPLAACLVALSPGLGGLALAAVVPFALGIAELRKKARGASERAQALVESLDCGVDELVRNADLWRAYGAGERVLAVVERAGAESGRAAARVESARAALSGANEVLAALAIAVAIAASRRFGLWGRAADLVPFAAVFFMAYRPLRDLGDGRSWASRGSVALAAVRTILAGARDDAPAIPAPVAFDPRATPARPPVVEAVAFGIQGRAIATSFRIEPGELVCLVGPTGSGKTSLLRALLGLERARGELRLDGRDATFAPAGPSQRPFAWVPQDAPLVTGTIAENVALLGGDPALAGRALEAVGFRVETHAPGDVVGPGGRPLSGGERRQVALARALSTELPVLLLDEPTEGLDGEARRIVLESLERLRGKRSLLVATHQDEVVAIADRVIRIGETEPEGAHPAPQSGLRAAAPSSLRPRHSLRSPP
jgi:ABC-type multidrug transport system fused ATPase/permease subunit